MAVEVLAIKNFFESRHILLSIPWIESFLEWCKQEDNLQPNYTEKDLQENVYEQWLLQDLRNIEIAALPKNISSQKCYTINGVFCLQIVKIVDISKPKLWQLQKIRNTLHDTTERDTNFSNRMLQLTLTDGVQKIEAMEMHTIACLSLDLAPGTKIKLLGPAKVRRGRVMLESKHIKVLGGEVEELKVENSIENVLARALDNMSQNLTPANASNRGLPIERFVRADVNRNLPLRSGSPAFQTNNQTRQSINPTASNDESDQLIKKMRAHSFSNSTFPEDEFLIDDEMLLEAEKRINESKNILTVPELPDMMQIYDSDKSLLNYAGLVALDENMPIPKTNQESRENGAFGKQDTVLDFDLDDSVLEKIEIPDINTKPFLPSIISVPQGNKFVQNNGANTTVLKPLKNSIQDFDLNNSILEKIQIPERKTSNTITIPKTRQSFLQDYNIRPAISKPICDADNKLYRKTKTPDLNPNILKHDLVASENFKPEIKLDGSKPCMTTIEHYDLDDSVFDKIEIPDLKPNIKSEDKIIATDQIMSTLEGKLESSHPQTLLCCELGDAKLKKIVCENKTTISNPRNPIIHNKVFPSANNMQQCSKITGYQPVNRIEKFQDINLDESIFDDSPFKTYNNGGLKLNTDNVKCNTTNIYAPRSSIPNLNREFSGIIFPLLSRNNFNLAGSSYMVNNNPLPIKQQFNININYPQHPSSTYPITNKSYFANHTLKIQQEITPKTNSIVPITNTPCQLKRIISIEQLKAMKYYPQPAKCMIKAKFKRLIEKFTIKNNETNLVIMVEDSSGELPLKVQSEVICKLAVCTYEHLANFKKLYYSQDFEVLKRLQSKIEGLNTVMEIEIKDNGNTFMLTKAHE